MVVKDKMFKLIILNDLNCNAFSQHLEKMAREGWMFYGNIGPLFKFKKEEPKDLNFNIDLFYDADSSTKKMIKSYIDICDASGWKYISKCGYYYIFCSEDNNTVDFETDFEAKLVKHRTGMVLYGILLFFSLVSLILSILSVKMDYDLYNDYLSLVIENPEIFGPVSDLDMASSPNISDAILYIGCELVSAVMWGKAFISNFIWYRKCKDKLSYNEEVSYISYDTAMANNKLYKFVGVNFIVLTILFAILIKNNLMYLKIICILLMTIIILTLIYTLIKVTREIQHS